ASLKAAVGCLRNAVRKDESNQFIRGPSCPWTSVKYRSPITQHIWPTSCSFAAHARAFAIHARKVNCCFSQRPLGSDVMTMAQSTSDFHVVPQPVAAPLTRAAIFLVVAIKPTPESRATVRSFCGDIAALFRAVEFRNLEAGLSCVTAFGSEAWDLLFGTPRPA